MKHDLKQQVAKFVLERYEIITLNGIGDFIGFFNCVGRNRRKVLRNIPGTASVTIT